MEAFYTHVISAPSLHRASTDALIAQPSVKDIYSDEKDCGEVTGASEKEEEDIYEPIPGDQLYYSSIATINYYLFYETDFVDL